MKPNLKTKRVENRKPKKIKDGPRTKRKNLICEMCALSHVSLKLFVCLSARGLDMFEFPENDLSQLLTLFK